MRKGKNFNRGNRRPAGRRESLRNSRDCGRAVTVSSPAVVAIESEYDFLASPTGDDLRNIIGEDIYLQSIETETDDQYDDKVLDGEVLEDEEDEDDIEDGDEIDEVETKTDQNSEEPKPISSWIDLGIHASAGMLLLIVSTVLANLCLTGIGLVYSMSDYGYTVWADVYAVSATIAAGSFAISIGIMAWIQINFCRNNALLPRNATLIWILAASLSWSLYANGLISDPLANVLGEIKNHSPVEMQKQVDLLQERESEIKSINQRQEMWNRIEKARLEKPATVPTRPMRRSEIDTTTSADQRNQDKYDYRDAPKKLTKADLAEWRKIAAVLNSITQSQRESRDQEIAPRFP